MVMMGIVVITLMIVYIDIVLIYSHNAIYVLMLAIYFMYSLIPSLYSEYVVRPNEMWSVLFSLTLTHTFSDSYPIKINNLRDALSHFSIYRV